MTTTKQHTVTAALLGSGILLGYVAAIGFSRKTAYVPGKIWKFKPQGGKFGSINKPSAGPQNNKALPKGTHEIQLYSLATPNGVKVTSLLEELNLKYGLEYDAYSVKIFNGAQFDSGFVDVNPNSKIPALLHYKDGLDKPPIRIFESGAIMLYLCETFDTERVFLPDPKTEPGKYAECISFLNFMQGSGPYVGGGFGHFYNYAPIKIEYAIDRYSMELCGENITIADFALYPWYGLLARGKLYDGSFTFLNVEEYPHVIAWANKIYEREGVKRGAMVNRTWGEDDKLVERHSSKDFEQK